MNNKLLCTILLSILIIFIFYIFNKKLNVEHFASNQWTTNKKTLESEKVPLNDVQKEEVKNMVSSLTQSKLKTLIASQSPLLTGPQGVQGMQGPPGTKLVASGRLVNKNGSFDTKVVEGQSFFVPKYIATRTEGTNNLSSLAFMDQIAPFTSYQNWSLDINQNIKNRYDGNCLTMSSTQDKLYMDKCTDTNANQKWDWDRSNRIISTTASTDTNLKCIGLTKPEVNVLTTNVPGCSGADCKTNTARQYLIVKDCDINNINDDELWSFV